MTDLEACLNAIHERRAACRVCHQPIIRTSGQWWHQDPDLNDDGSGRVDHDAWPPRDLAPNAKKPPHP